MATTFDEVFALPPRATVALGKAAFVFRGAALPVMDELLPELRKIIGHAPLRHLVTRGGSTMSVATTNCGRLGWISDRRGYRYTEIDPASGEAWPAMPRVFCQLATEAAAKAGFPHVLPDACLINQYRVGSRLSLHQDKNERDFSMPIVSVSLGMSAVFLFGGQRREEKAMRVPLSHGDIAVWGGEDRLRFHGVLPLDGGPHPTLGEQRINLTFRKAG
jgi:alkylated DNA repair protein (DNA oxidative demethylase)